MIRWTLCPIFEINVIKTKGNLVSSQETTIQYSYKESFERLHRLMIGSYKLLVMPVTLILLLEIGHMLARVLTANLFDYIESGDTTSIGMLIILIMLQDYIFLMVDVLVIRNIVIKIGYRLWKEMTMRVVTHVAYLGADFFSSIPISKINDRIRKIDRIVDLIEMACWNVVGNILQAIITIVVLAFVQPFAIPITLISFYLFYVFNSKTIKNQTPARARRKETEEKFVAEPAMRVIQANGTLSANTALDRTLQWLNTGFDKVLRVGKVELGYALVGSGIMRDVVLFLGRRGILALTLMMAANYQMMSISEVVLTYTLVETMFISVWGIVRFLHQFDYEMPSIANVDELVMLERSVQEPDNPISITSGPLQYVFDMVSFQYQRIELRSTAEEKSRSTKAEVIRNRYGLTDPKVETNQEKNNQLIGINLVVNAGEKVALVGESGAGKSTLAGLFTRSRLPQIGTITVNGVDISNVSSAQLQSRIAIVPQGTAIDIFNDTLIYNVTLGDPRFTEDDVVQALRMASLWETVSRWPENIYEMIGERGRTMSGGQQQRLAIARAVIRNPDLIILDEATSALDTATERKIQESLDKLMVGRTAIIIAHRLSTIKDVDKIVVMTNGKIVEVGTWEELIQANGEFYRMVISQQLED